MSLEATRRRRRILQAGSFLKKLSKNSLYFVDEKFFTNPVISFILSNTATQKEVIASIYLFLYRHLQCIAEPVFIRAFRPLVFQQDHFIFSERNRI